MPYRSLGTALCMYEFFFSFATLVSRLQGKYIILGRGDSAETSHRHVIVMNLETGRRFLQGERLYLH